jgi:hypothetical protein
MISLNYDAGWRRAEEPAGDRRLIFSVDCAEAFAAPSKYGVNRNFR